MKSIVMEIDFVVRFLLMCWINIYTIGNQLKWRADVKPLSFRNTGSMSVWFIDISNEENSYVAKINNFAYHYDRDKCINWFHVSSVLPQSLVGSSVIIELIEYNGKSLLEPLKKNMPICFAKSSLRFVVLTKVKNLLIQKFHI